MDRTKETKEALSYLGLDYEHCNATEIKNAFLLKKQEIQAKKEQYQTDLKSATLAGHKVNVLVMKIIGCNAELSELEYVYDYLRKM